MKELKDMTEREKQIAQFERDRVLAGNFGKHESRLTRIRLERQYKRRPDKTE